MHYSKSYLELAASGLVVYEPETGRFLNKKGIARRVRKDHRGYIRIRFSKFGNILAHRLAWAIMHGSLPETHIDHIDGDKGNNKFNNLRLCTHNQNQHNQGIRKSNTSGYKGVSFMKRIGKWQAQICCNSKVKNLGFFTEKEDAAHAYDIAALKTHGEFAWTNFPKSLYETQQPEGCACNQRAECS